MMHWWCEIFLDRHLCPVNNERRKHIMKVIVGRIILKIIIVREEDNK